MLRLHCSAACASWRGTFLTNPPVKQIRVLTPIGGDEVVDEEGVKLDDVVAHLVDLFGTCLAWGIGIGEDRSETNG